jgi:hypothetical protein
MKQRYCTSSLIFEATIKFTMWPASTVKPFQSENLGGKHTSTGGPNGTLCIIQDLPLNRRIGQDIEGHDQKQLNFGNFSMVFNSLTNIGSKSAA